MEARTARKIESMNHQQLMEFVLRERRFNDSTQLEEQRYALGILLERTEDEGYARGKYAASYIHS